MARRSADDGDVPGGVLVRPGLPRSEPLRDVFARQQLGRAADVCDERPGDADVDHVHVARHVGARRREKAELVMRERRGGAGTYDDTEDAPRVGVETRRQVDREAGRDRGVHGAHDVGVVPLDVAAEPRAEEGVDHDVRVGQAPVEQGDVGSRSQLVHRAAEAAPRFEVREGVRGQALCLTHQVDLGGGTPHDQMPRDDQPVAPVVTGAAHHRNASPGRVALEQLAHQHVGRSPARVLHEEQAGDVAHLDRVRVEGTHLRAREHGRHGSLVVRGLAQLVLGLRRRQAARRSARRAAR